jgi:hypothetical protein
LDGSYRLDSLPPGDASIAVRTDSLDMYALLAEARRVTLRPGETRRLDFRGPDAAALRRLACPASVVSFPGRRRPARGILRLVVVDVATGVPVPGIGFVATWPAAIEDPRPDPVRQGRQEAVSDSRGAATFCDLPEGISLDVSLSGPIGPVYAFTTLLRRGGFAGRIVGIRR